MNRWFPTVVDVQSGASTLRAQRFGTIEMVDGRLQAVRCRPWPKLGSLVEARLWGSWLHGRLRGDRCRLYYNQPWGHSNFLALRYVVSTRDCSLSTLRGALLVLERIAQLKGTDAILCQACNPRITDRMLVREGWQPHTSNARARHFIKRLYPVPLPRPALACQRAHDDI